MKARTVRESFLISLFIFLHLFQTLFGQRRKLYFATTLAKPLLPVPRSKYQRKNLACHVYDEFVPISYICSNRFGLLCTDSVFCAFVSEIRRTDESLPRQVFFAPAHEWSDDNSSGMHGRHEKAGSKRFLGGPAEKENIQRLSCFLGGQCSFPADCTCTAPGVEHRRVPGGSSAWRRARWQ